MTSSGEPASRAVLATLAVVIPTTDLASEDNLSISLTYMAIDAIVSVLTAIPFRTR